MATDWGTAKLGDVIDLFDSQRVPLNSRQRQERRGQYPYYGAQGIIDHIDGYIFDGRYILVAKDGENLNSKKLPLALFATGKFWVNNHAHIIRGKPNVADDTFLLACLNNADIKPYVTGAAQPKLSQGNLRLIEIPFPPLAVQQRIAGILSAYDELIENSQRRIKILETMARALYREWFVHFRFPGHDNSAGELNWKAEEGPEGVSAMDGANQHYPGVDSSLGEIPQGWEAASFEQAATFENGDRGKNYPSGSDFVDQGIPFINAGHLVDGAVDIANVNFVLQEKFDQLRSGKIRNGDILFCLRGSPGRTSRTAGLSRGAIASSLVIIRPTERTNEEYLYFTLSGEIGKRMVSELNNGAAQPNVSVGSVQRYPIVLPPQGLLNRFAQSIKPILRNIDLLRDQLANLRKQRDLLLPRLLSGQITLPEAADDLTEETTHA
ncbi:MAG: restriction endonuclease subunit S [Methylococcaceae bacterium]|nr:restriction endonuclease subunit S [Methylococcaceae bacterium]